MLWGLLPPSYLGKNCNLCPTRAGNPWSQNQVLLFGVPVGHGLFQKSRIDIKRA